MTVRNPTIATKGRYSKVSRHMWNDERVRRLSPPAPSGFVLFTRLLVGPELTNVPGLFPAWEAGMAQALKWDLEAFRVAFAEVYRQGLAESDWDAGLVWVPKAIEHNRPESPKVVLSWSVTIAELPDCDLKNRAIHALGEQIKAMGEAWAKAWVKAIPKPSVKAIGEPIVNQKQEQEQKQNEREARAKNPEAILGHRRFVDSECPDEIEPLEKTTELIRSRGMPPVAELLDAFISARRKVGARCGNWPEDFHGYVRKWNMTDIRNGKKPIKHLAEGERPSMTAEEAGIPL